MLLVPDCPHGPAVAESVRRALDDVGLVGVPTRVEVVTTHGDAERLRFVGSPTVRIGGEDPFGDPRLPAGLACRVYRTGGAARSVPDPAGCGRRCSGTSTSEADDRYQG